MGSTLSDTETLFDGAGEAVGADESVGVSVAVSMDTGGVVADDPPGEV